MGKTEKKPKENHTTKVTKIPKTKIRLLCQTKNFEKIKEPTNTCTTMSN